MRGLALSFALLASACGGPGAARIAPVAIGAPADHETGDCTPNPHLARARDHYNRLMFDRAAAALQRAIERPHNCRDELAEIYELKAFIDAING